MKTEIFEKILTPILEGYFNIDFDFENKSLPFHNIQIKERVATIRNMKIIIYSNDHNRPHFHVISNDKSINAKFTLDKCELIDGVINATDIKRIKAFYENPKTQLVLHAIWNKRNQSL